jgi:pimeloyl-[acyl-carrier protein] methyl ester esterase
MAAGGFLLAALYQISESRSAAIDYNARMSMPTRILLHGWGMSPDLFAPLSSALGTASVYAPPLPGYPHSPWPGEPDFGAQVERMLPDLPDGHLIGWSLGGLYAIALARRDPDKFDRVTLLASNPCFVRRPGWSCGIEAAVFEGFSADLARDWRRTLRRFLALQMHGEASARQRAREVAETILARGAPNVEVLAFGLSLLKAHDARPDLARLSQPVEMILGERDLLVPRGLKQQISEVAPGIRVESVAGAAHAPFLSHTTEVVALLGPR